MYILDEDKTEADALPDSVSNQGEDTEKTSADNTDSGATEGSEAAASGETPADNAASEEAATANGEEDMVADEGEEDGTEDDGEATNSSQVTKYFWPVNCQVQTRCIVYSANFDMFFMVERLLENGLLCSKHFLTMQRVCDWLASVHVFNLTCRPQS